jgi:omega-amidase
MRVGLAQINCSGSDIAARCAQYTLYAGRAAEQGCQALLFPEMSDTGYVPALMRARACSWDDLPFHTLQNCGAKHGLYVIAGISERAEGVIYNSLAIISPTGTLLGRYRKTHLFSPAPCYEDQIFGAGSSLTLMPIGDLVWGFSICYDLRFPELYRSLTLRGAQVLVNCAAWPALRPTHWEILTRAREVENQAYVLGVNHVGIEGEMGFCGQSCIVDPSGEAVHLDAEQEGLLVGEIHPEPIRSARSSIPVLVQRRADLYGTF